MIHSDDRGLVLPPRVAQTQVVLIPIVKKDTPQELKDKLHEIAQSLQQRGLKVHVDDRENYNPGFKFNHWELRGVPVRLELGPNDLAKNEVRLVTRFNGNKQQASIDGLADKLSVMMDEIHDDMYRTALEKREQRTERCQDWGSFMAALNRKNIVLAPWCGTVECEQRVKQRSAEESQAYIEAQGDSGEDLLTGSAKTLNVPYEQPELPENCTCFACSLKATVTALWGRSY